jgi:hypothetical protein
MFVFNRDVVARNWCELALAARSSPSQKEDAEELEEEERILMRKNRRRNKSRYSGRTSDYML